MNNPAMTIKGEQAKKQLIVPHWRSLVNME